MSFLMKFADELKLRNVEVLPPIYVNGGGKVGINATHQFTCHHEYSISELIDRCLEVSPNKLQFVELVLPSKSVDRALLLIKENILLRYIKMQSVRTGEPMEYWDALIQAT